MVCLRIHHVRCTFSRFFKCLCVITANIAAIERSTTTGRSRYIPNDINRKLLVFQLKASAYYWPILAQYARFSATQQDLAGCWGEKYLFISKMTFVVFDIGFSIRAAPHRRMRRMARRLASLFWPKTAPRLCNMPSKPLLRPICAMSMSSPTQHQ